MRFWIVNWVIVYLVIMMCVLCGEFWVRYLWVLRGVKWIFWSGWGMVCVFLVMCFVIGLMLRFCVVWLSGGWCRLWV